MQSNLGINIHKSEGIVDYSEDSLARDASLIVAHPYPPGDTFFYVDDPLQIKAGDKILYSTEAENNPAFFHDAASKLYRARIQQARLLPVAPQYQELADEIYRLTQMLVNYYQGRKRVKAERLVSYVDPARKLIAVDKPFTHGYKPRVMGSVVRILGFRQDSVDEPTTDKLHKEAKKRYGSYDWQSEWRATGSFPTFR